MKAVRLETPNPLVHLIEPDIERDAQLGVQWLEGEIGYNTLSLMGVAEKDNHESTLDKERERIKDFIEKSDQINWMIQLDEKVVGSIWVDLKPSHELPSPSVHIMIGDTTARGRGVGNASTKAVIDYLQKQGNEAIFSRTLVKNSVAANLLRENGFEPLGGIYVDKDGLEWQNARLDLVN